MTIPLLQRGSRHRIAVVVVMALAACTPHGRLEAFRAELKRLHADRRPLPALPGYQDFRGVIHVHSRLSWDSRGTPEEILQAAGQAGLHWLVVTDHNAPTIFTEGLHGWQKDLLVIRGAELSHRQSSLLAIAPSAYVEHFSESGHAREVLDRIIRAVKATGGLVFLAHPGRFQDWSVTGYDGMEIYDLADAARSWRHLLRLPRYLLDLVYSYDAYPDELALDVVRVGFGWHPGYPLQRWDRLTLNRRVVGIAGNDAHQNLRLLGRQLDPYALVFRVVNTHVIAPRLDEPALLAALQQGHVYVAFDLLADAQGFSFVARDRDGVRGLMGDEVVLDDDLVLEVIVPRPGILRLIKDGRLIRQGTIEAAQVHRPEAPGVYRVEVWLEADGRWWPWVFSNPIYVRTGPGSSDIERDNRSG